MKNFNILIFMLFILLSFDLKTKAQEDTVIIENSTEPIKESDFKQKRKYKYLDNNFREEKTIIKLGTSPMDYFNYYYTYDVKDIFNQFNFFLMLESKIRPSISVTLNSSVTYHKDDPQNEWGISGELGARYYYSINKRIKKKSGADNFHNNYLSIGLEEWVRYGASGDQPLYPNLYLNLVWGMQRRIGNVGFVDVVPYSKFRPEYYEFGLKLQVGLAYGFINPIFKTSYYNNQ